MLLTFVLETVNAPWYAVRARLFVSFGNRERCCRYGEVGDNDNLCAGDILARCPIKLLLLTDQGLAHTTDPRQSASRHDECLRR